MSARQFQRLTALVGYGARMFDPEAHEPPLTSAPRPDYLAPLADFPHLPWAEPCVNRGEADVALQLTASRGAAVSIAAVEVAKLIADLGLPLQVERDLRRLRARRPPRLARLPRRHQQPRGRPAPGGARRPA